MYKLAVLVALRWIRRSMPEVLIPAMLADA